MKRTIAAFDFDGTLTCKDTLWAFLKHTHHPVRRIWNMFLVSPVLFLFLMGLIKNGKAKEKLFARFYKNLPLADFSAFCRSFCPIIDACLRSDIYQKMKQHQAEGHEVIIVSASIENWIKPWAAKEGIPTVIATQIEISPSGYLTGRFASPNCYGSEKPRRILELFPDRASYTLIAYGNSRGDHEMLRMCETTALQMPPNEDDGITNAAERDKCQMPNGTNAAHFPN